MERNIYKIGKELFITSDEEIKEGNWVYDETSKELVYSVNVLPIPEEYPWQKIILTTDQELIKEGVQPIDNEFLEWFVKNPSCEEVEVDTWSDDLDGYWLKKYKIIIPKEEPKFENSINDTINLMNMANSMFGKNRENTNHTIA